MKVEIRDDKVLIDGYVNAVERDSKVLRDHKGTPFIERIKAGCFKRALSRANNTRSYVKVLLNHNYDRELTSTHDSTTKLFEDSIGLRCQCEIRDKEVVEDAKSGKLTGWSFGFIPIKQTRVAPEGSVEHRDVEELELREVSILDNTRIPAYDGTSIETRSESIDDVIEIRFSNDETEVVDKTTKAKEETFNNHEWENRYLATRANLVSS